MQTTMLRTSKASIIINSSDFTLVKHQHYTCYLYFVSLVVITAAEATKTGYLGFRLSGLHLHPLLPPLLHPLLLLAS